MRLIIPRPDSYVKRFSLETARKNYMDLAHQTNSMIQGEIIHCPICGEWLAPDKDKFYVSKEYAFGVFPICRECLLTIATDYDGKTKRRIDNRNKTVRVFSMLNIPFYETLYRDCLENIKNNNFKSGKTAYQQMISVITSLPQYQNLTFEHSSFENEELGYELETNRKARKEIKKLFGAGYTEGDYLFLQDQYDDFRARTQVDSKSQEIYVTQICQQLLEIDKARKAGKDVTKLLSALDAFMASAKLQPKQNVNNAATDSLSFGQLIEKFETERPIPEPDPEFKDVNGIGKLIRVYFAGHLSKALGLKNSYSQEYEEEMKKYTVEPPQTKEGDSSDTYQQIFGANEG